MKKGKIYSRYQIVWDLYLEIEQKDMPLRRLWIYYQFNYGAPLPQAGDKVAIYIHPEKPDKIVIVL